MPNNRNNYNTWWTLATVSAGAAAISAGAYYLTRNSDESHRSSHSQAQRASVESRNIDSLRTLGSTVSNCVDYLSRLTRNESDMVDRNNIPRNPVISNLNALLADINVRYIAIKRDEFDHHYKVFMKVFDQLHVYIKEMDPYYNRYSSTVHFAGSHYDRSRIKKPDEFDMDIVIGLPLNLRPNYDNPQQSDIILEAKGAGFIQLKMGQQFKNLPNRDEWHINKTAYHWKDEKDYLLRSKFIDWFKSAVKRGLNKFDVNNNGDPYLDIDGIRYSVHTSESGPAITLKIRNVSNRFQLDVDLVPCLKFPEDRWPVARGYRDIPVNCKKDVWLVVPKPNKEASISQDVARSWRIAMTNQERQYMNNSYNLRQGYRLLKKLRDSMEMKKIASYYIKTLIMWEVHEVNDPEYWKRTSPAVIFDRMVRKFYLALVQGKIRYFWNSSNNLIGTIGRNILAAYAAKIEKLINVLNEPSEYKQVAKFLLSPQEFEEYKAILHI